MSGHDWVVLLLLAAAALILLGWGLTGDREPESLGPVEPEPKHRAEES